MDAIQELLSNLGWMIHDLVDSGMIGNEDEELLLGIKGNVEEHLPLLRARIDRLEKIEAVAEDVNGWLKKEAGLEGTGHQRSLEAALRGE